MKESLTISSRFNTTASTLFHAWLNSETHSAMTGGEALCSAEVGAEYSAWDGYISGKNVSFIPNKEIVQTWRTTEFSDADEDSHLVVTFKDLNDGCEMTIAHTNIPEGQTQYQKGWVDFYIEPMSVHFG